eukprot:SAG31_NODE_15287_length_762_cov_1.143288_2_plen_47_part_01
MVVVETEMARSFQPWLFQTAWLHSSSGASVGLAPDACIEEIALHIHG